MIDWVWLWAAVFLPLPFLVWWGLPPVQEAKKAALKIPFLEDFQSNENSFTLTTENRWSLILFMLAWVFLVAASMRPLWLGEPIELAVNGRDLLLAVDLSYSMRETDFDINGNKVNRLQAVKHVAKDFIKRRTGDRLGLILFGTNAYLQTPLTFDRTSVAILLEEAAIGLAGKQTAIGDAIGLGIKRLKNQKNNAKVLILLTDGANTTGSITPIKAAQLAKEFKLKIYTIGIGGKPQVVNSIFGTRMVDPAQDLDEKTLSEIATLTGGQYFRAYDTKSLANIYQILDRYEPIERDRQLFHPRSELFHYPLSVALVLVFFGSILRIKMA